MRFPTLIVPSLAAILGLTCKDATAPSLGPLVYEIFTGCIPPRPALDCPQDVTTVSRPDTLLVGHSLADTSGANTDSVLVVAVCAVNFEIRGPAGELLTLPPVPTCPDSVVSKGDNAPGIYNLRVYPWSIPSGARPGVYTITSRLLVYPAAVRRVSVRVQ